MSANLIDPQKSVLCVATEERAINYVWYEPHKKLSQHIQVLSQTAIPSILNSGKFSLPHNTAVGDVLLKHPFEPNTYIRIEKAQHAFRLSKFLKMAEIAQLLGAESYDVDAAWQEINKRSCDANGNLSFQRVQVSTDIHSDEMKMNEMGIKAHCDYDGIRTVTFQAWQKAESRAKKYNLWDDEGVRSLIRQRNPQEENFINHLSISLNITSELEDCLDAAATLSVMPNIFELKASVKEAISYQEKLTVKITFNFPKNVLY